MKKTIYEFTGGNKVIALDHGKPKKVTGGRLSSILHENDSVTDFAVWCEIMRIASRPFDRTRAMTMDDNEIRSMTDIVSKMSKYDIMLPQDLWGATCKKDRFYDFFDDPVFGGMWDSLLLHNGKIIGVMMMKKTGNVTTFANAENDVPSYWKRAAQLYAYLIGTPYYHIAMKFEHWDNDYTTKKDDNTDRSDVEFDDGEIRIFHDRVPVDFADEMEHAREWWNNHVIDGVSPEYDEERDWWYLDYMRRKSVVSDPDTAKKYSELIAKAS